MSRTIESLPEVMVLKSGEHISREIAEAMLRTLHDLIQAQPIEFYNLTQLLRRDYTRAAKRLMRKCFPQAQSATAELMLAVLKSALVDDKMATRLESPYDMAASYQGTGGLYDQHLYQTAHRIADTVYQTSLNFGNKERCTWMEDDRNTTPAPKEDRAKGLFLLAYNRMFPYQLVTPWGTWRFADYTDYTSDSLLWKGETSFLEAATAELEMEKVSVRPRLAIFAIDKAFGEVLPRATILPKLENAGESQYRYITSVWKHAAEWLDPGRYF